MNINGVGFLIVVIILTIMFQALNKITSTLVYVLAGLLLLISIAIILSEILKKIRPAANHFNVYPSSFLTLNSIFSFQKPKFQSLKNILIKSYFQDLLNTGFCFF